MAHIAATPTKATTSTMEQANPLNSKPLPHMPLPCLFDDEDEDEGFLSSSFKNKNEAATSVLRYGFDTPQQRHILLKPTFQLRERPQQGSAFSSFSACRPTVVPPLEPAPLPESSESHAKPPKPTESSSSSPPPRLVLSSGHKHPLLLLDEDDDEDHDLERELWNAGEPFPNNKFKSHIRPHPSSREILWVGADEGEREKLAIPDDLDDEQQQQVPACRIRPTLRPRLLKRPRLELGDLFVHSSPLL